LAAANVTAADRDSRLAAAAKRQDMTAVRALLKQRADVNTADPEGMTALHWAAHWNSLDTVRTLIAAGAKPNVANRYGVTPLHQAATVANAAMVNALLKAGASRRLWRRRGAGDDPSPRAVRKRSASPRKRRSYRLQSSRSNAMLAAVGVRGHREGPIDAGANPGACAPRMRLRRNGSGAASSTGRRRFGDAHPPPRGGRSRR
jgi:ankyrin repeat protein